MVSGCSLLCVVAVVWERPNRVPWNVR